MKHLLDPFLQSCARSQRMENDYYIYVPSLLHFFGVCATSLELRPLNLPQPSLFMNHTPSSFSLSELSLPLRLHLLLHFRFSSSLYVQTLRMMCKDFTPQADIAPFSQVAHVICFSPCLQTWRALCFVVIMRVRDGGHIGTRCLLSAIGFFVLSS